MSQTVNRPYFTIPNADEWVAVPRQMEQTEPIEIKEQENGVYVKTDNQSGWFPKDSDMAKALLICKDAIDEHKNDLSMKTIKTSTISTLNDFFKAHYEDILLDSIVYGSSFFNVIANIDGGN